MFGSDKFCARRAIPGRREIAYAFGCVSLKTVNAVKHARVWTRVWGEARLKKKKEYVFTGDPVPKIDSRRHPEFILAYQRAILLSLLKRELLTASQYRQCLERLERS